MREKSSRVLTSLAGATRCGAPGPARRGPAGRPTRPARKSSTGPRINVSGVRNSWLMLEKNVGLRAVQFGQLLGPLLLSLVAACAANARGDVSGDELDEAPIAVVERSVAVQRGDQEPHWRATLLQQGNHQCPRPAGRPRLPTAGRASARPDPPKRSRRGPPRRRARWWSRAESLCGTAR